MLLLTGVAGALAFAAMNQPTADARTVAAASERIAQESAARRDAEAAAAEAAREAKTTTINRPDSRNLAALFIGDSLSNDSYTTAPELGWTSLVASGLGQSLPVDRSVVATNGQTTGDALSREYPANQDLVFVELGTNDVGRSTPLDEFARTYASLLSGVLEASPRAQIICLSPWNSVERSAEYAAAIDEACVAVGGRTTSISQIYTTQGMRAQVGDAYFGGLAPDNFHPNDAGHRAIADAVLAWISVQ